MEKLNKWKEEYENVAIPEGLKEGMELAMRRAGRDRRRGQIRRRSWIGAAAAMVIMVGIPNISAEAAAALGNLPFVGGFFRLVTIREYEYEDEHNIAHVEVPGLVRETQADDEQTAFKETEDFGDTSSPRDMNLEKSVKELNLQIETYINGLIGDFETNKEEITDGYQELDVGYEVVTDTDEWLTLKVDSTNIMASAARQIRYFHLNKETGELAALKDIFREDADYVTVLSDEIKRQMVMNMEADEAIAYFYQSEEMPEEDFEQIKEDQSFYFNAEGELVLSFDEYEVAPGYMGVVEFTIPGEVWENIRRQR